MLKIRLQRVGRKNIPTFRIVVTESQNSTKSGKYLEVVGTYDAVHNVKEIKADRVKHWMSLGAQVSDTLNNFLIDKKIISGDKKNVLSHTRPIVAKDEKAGGEAKASPAAEAPKAEAVPVEAPKA